MPADHMTAYALAEPAGVDSANNKVSIGDTTFREMCPDGFSDKPINPLPVAGLADIASMTPNAYVTEMRRMLDSLCTRKHHLNWNRDKSRAPCNRNEQRLRTGCHHNEHQIFREQIDVLHRIEIIQNGQFETLQSLIEKIMKLSGCVEGLVTNLNSIVNSNEKSGAPFSPIIESIGARNLASHQVFLSPWIMTRSRVEQIIDTQDRYIKTCLIRMRRFLKSVMGIASQDDVQLFDDFHSQAQAFIDLEFDCCVEETENLIGRAQKHIYPSVSL